MTTSPTTTSPAASVSLTRSTRRWQKFSLRTLLILVTLVAVGLGLLMRHVNEQREMVQREKAAVAELQKLGGSVIHAIQAEPVLSSLPVWLRTILGDEEYQPVESVLYRANMGIVEMGKKHPIEGLPSSNKQNKDAGLKHIGQFKSVGSLYLENMHFKDTELEYLVKLTSLKHIDLQNTPITDAGLEHLGKLTTLQSLDLSNTKITDAGLEHIRKLTVLKTLSLNNTQITDEGLAKLKAALPQCRIYWSSPEKVRP